MTNRLELLLFEKISPGRFKTMLRATPDGARREAELPLTGDFGEAMTRRGFFQGAVRALYSKGYLDDAFFDALAAEIPPEAEQVRAIQRDLQPVGDAPPTVQPGQIAPASLLQRVRRAQNAPGALYELLMGLGRPVELGAFFARALSRDPDINRKFVSNLPDPRWADLSDYAFQASQLLDRHGFLNPDPAGVLFRNLIAQWGNEREAIETVYRLWHPQGPAIG